MMKRQLWTSSEFIPISLRVFPPLRRGGQGGWSRRNQCGLVRGFGSAGPAELRRWPRLLVMPCSPPLTLG